MSQEGRRDLAHVPGLDGLRGLAVLMVVALHIGFVIRPADSIFPGGFLGVDVFFVLSGFLITAILLTELERRDALSFKNFYLRRACRLFPALGALLVLHGLYALVHDDPLKAEAKALASIALYVGNLWQSADRFTPNELKQTWSLAVEEQFYLIWPAVVVATVRHRRSSRAVPLVVWLGIAAAAVSRIVTWRTQGYPDAYMRLDVRADSLLAGAAVAFLWQRGALPRRAVNVLASAAIAAILVVAVTYGRFSTWLFYGGFTAVAAATAIVIVAVLQDGWQGSRVLSVRPLRLVGRVSYGLYLWHVVAITMVQRHLAGVPVGGRVVIALVASAAATAASWRFVEQPFLRLKRRWSSHGEVGVDAPDDGDAAGVPGGAAVIGGAAEPAVP